MLKRPSYYINLGIRVFFGTLAGSVRLLPHIILSVLTGKSLPKYNPNAIELGASILRNVDGTNINNFTDITITTEDGIKLHAVIDDGERQKSGKRPIVFVHGFPELWISWHEQMEYFAKEGHPILSLDMRGYGMSDKPVGIDQYRVYEHLVKDIGAAIDCASRLNQKGEKMKPLLVAHDWGAGVCWSYVCQKQTIDNELLAGYVSLAVPPSKAFEDNMTLKQGWASLYMIFFNMPWLPEKTFLANDAWVIASIMNDTKRAKIPVWLSNTYRANVLQKGAMQAQFNYYRAAIQQPPDKAKVVDAYGTKENPLPLPTLVIRGIDDSALGDDIFRGLEKYLKNYKIVALEQCSHWIQADCPNEVNTEIEGFLAEINDVRNVDK